MTPDGLLAELRVVREAVAMEGAAILAGWQDCIARPRFAENAANLPSYLALRHRDLRPMQTALMTLGLSSLGRAEGRVLVNLDATLASLAAVAGAAALPRPDELTFFHGNALLAAAREELFDYLAVGHRVYVDDGRFGGAVERLDADGATIVINHAAPDGAKKAEKGLNLPDTALSVPALTAKDLADLDVVAQAADLVGYSFVQTPEDIVALQAALAERVPDRWRELGIVTKIETPLAVHNLPQLIVRAAGRQPLALMIARGDLAVEIGFERLAEMQEEILWLAEAAHVPVIWATQVLESLVKLGLPSRGEMTDAAMAARAECVMLNKGPFVVDAVRALDRLLARMAEHQNKKTPKLRALTSW